MAPVPVSAEPEREGGRAVTFSRVAVWGTLLFLAILALILGVGIALALTDRGEIGTWLRALRDFLALALLLELTLLTIVTIVFLWRLIRFVEEMSEELSALSGDARETAQIARESVQTLHQHLVQPLLYARAVLVELRETLRAWAGLKRATGVDDATTPAQPEPESN